IAKRIQHVSNTGFAWAQMAMSEVGKFVDSHGISLGVDNVHPLDPSPSVVDLRDFPYPGSPVGELRNQLLSRLACSKLYGYLRVVPYPGCPVGELRNQLLSRLACSKRYGYLRVSWGGSRTVGAQVGWALPLAMRGHIRLCFGSQYSWSATI